jgi:hypothetical protein
MESVGTTVPTNISSLREREKKCGLRVAKNTEKLHHVSGSLPREHVQIIVTHFTPSTIKKTISILCVTCFVVYNLCTLSLKSIICLAAKSK